MSNFVYAPAMQMFAMADLDWETIEARAVLVREEVDHYVPDQVAHQFLLDIPEDDRLGTSEPLTGKLVLNDGVLDADNAVLETVDALGASAHAVVIYAVVGGEETSPLIVHLSEMGGLPAQPNGTNIDLVWNDGVDRIIRI